MRIHDPPSSSRLADQISIILLSASLAMSPLAQAGKVIPDKHNPFKTNPVKVVTNIAESTVSGAAEAAAEVAEAVATPVAAVAAPVAEGVVHLVEETGQELDKQVFQPIKEGVEHASEQAAQEMTKAGKSVEYYVDEHTGEIILVIAVAGMIMVSCPCAVQVMGMNVGTLGVGIGSTAATAIAVPSDREIAGDDEKPTESSNSNSKPAAAPSVAAAAEQPPLVDSDKLFWDFGGRLLSTRTSENGHRPEGDVAETLGEAIAGEVADVITDSAKAGAQRSAQVLGAGAGLILESAETAPPSVAEYSEAQEISARLDNVLEQASKQVQFKQANDPNFKPAKSWAPPPDWKSGQKDGPTLKAAAPEPRELSIDERNRMKAGAIGAVTATHAEEVLAKVREGLVKDYQRRQERVAQSEQPTLSATPVVQAPIPVPVPTPAGGPNVAPEAPPTRMTVPVPEPAAVPMVQH